MGDTDEGREADAVVKKSSWDWWIRFVGYLKRKRYERITKKKEESSTDKAVRVTAAATVWMAVFTFVLALITAGTLLILKHQLREMQTTGTDTHELAVQAKNQSDQTKSLAEAAKSQSANTATVANAAIDQVAQLKAGVTETHRLALAASRQAKIAEDTFTEVNRPYLAVQSILVELGVLQIDVDLVTKNFGAGVAQDVLTYRAILVDGKPLQGLDDPNVDPEVTASDYFSGDIRHAPARMRGPQFADAILGKKPLVVEIGIRYRGTTKTYWYCKTFIYLADLQAFSPRGNNCPDVDPRVRDPAKEAEAK